MDDAVAFDSFPEFFSRHFIVHRWKVVVGIRRTIKIKIAKANAKANSKQQQHCREIKSSKYLDIERRKVRKLLVGAVGKTAAE